WAPEPEQSCFLSLGRSTATTRTASPPFGRSPQASTALIPPLATMEPTRSPRRRQPTPQLKSAQPGRHDLSFRAPRSAVVPLPLGLAGGSTDTTGTAPRPVVGRGDGPDANSVGRAPSWSITEPPPAQLERVS